MKNGEHLSLEQMWGFLEGNEEISFQAPNRKDLYEWAQATLCAQDYMSLHRSAKGLVKRYISKLTGLSRAQLTRLIAQYVASGVVQARRGHGKRYTAHYTPADIALLAEVDEAHETLSGPATRKLLYRGITSSPTSATNGWRIFHRRISTTCGSCAVTANA